MKKHILLLALIALFALSAGAQRIESSYVLSSNIKNDNGNRLGKGAVQYLTGNFSMPLSMERIVQIKNTLGSSVLPNGEIVIKEKSDTIATVRMWHLTFTGKYAAFDYEGTSLQHLPGNTINAGAMITHACPIAHRWSLVASAGITLNAVPSYIRLQSLAITSGIIFQYRVNSNLSLGAGVVGTTSFGQPVIIPVPMINWKRGGLYSIELNMHGKPQLTIATQATPKTKISLTPFDTEHFSALTNIGGEHKVFSQNIMKASLGISYRVAKHWSIDGEAAYIYHHTARIQERTVKAFWKNLFSGDNRMKYSGKVAFTVGLRYHFR